jgi:hypothetical protein
LHKRKKKYYAHDYKVASKCLRNHFFFFFFFFWQSLNLKDLTFSRQSLYMSPAEIV